MSQAIVNPMPSASQTPTMDRSDLVSLRNFVVDEDRANLGAEVWESIDKSSYILAQREAFEAFHMAKAIRLSEKSAGGEPHRANGQPAVRPTPSLAAAAGPTPAPSARSREGPAQQASSSSSSRARRPSLSQAIPAPKKETSQPPTANDEATARSLARSWQVEGVQNSLLEYRGRLPNPTSSVTSRPKTSAGSTSTSASTSIYAPQNPPIPSHHDKRPSLSKTPTSQNVSLSSLSSSTHSHHTQSHTSSSSSSHSQVSSRHSRSHSQSVSYTRPRAPSQVQPTRVEPRPILKRDPASVDGAFASISPPSSTRPNPTRTQSSIASTSIDPTQQKRRKASISQAPNPTSVSSTISPQAHYPYSPTTYSYFIPYSTNNANTNVSTMPTPTPTPGTSHASVQAQAHQAQIAQQVVAPLFEAKKQSSASSALSASSKDIRAGQMINPASGGSGSISASSSRPSSKETSPQVFMAALPFSGTSSASAQAAAAERENERSRSSSRQRAPVAPVSGTAPAQIQQPVLVQVQTPAPAQPQDLPPSVTRQEKPRDQSPRDIFAPVRFNCSKCGNAVNSVSQAQATQALTSSDTLSHPFAACLHLTCANASCGTVHCRGCLKAVKCRQSVHESDSLALVVVSTSPKPALPLKLTPTSCGGGSGCSLWNCCQNVQAVAICEALRAFDAVFAAEAGFAVGGSEVKDPQHQALGRQHREAYVRLLISKADKSMRKFEDAFIRTLKVVCSWLHASNSSFGDEEDDDDDDDDSEDDESEKSEDDDEDEDEDDDEDEDEEERRQEQRESRQKQLVSLFRSSYLLEVFHAFLSSNKPRDWIAHAETYLAILDMMRRMMDCGLGSVLTDAPGFPSSVGGSVSAPVSAVYTPFATPAGSSSSSASSSPSHSQQPPLSLNDVIKQLEKLRSPLMNLASRMQFSATVDKVNNLCDAISYLLLQQMVG